MSLLWAIISTSQSSTHNRFARISLAWVLYNLVWTASALNITKPVRGDTVDISFPYNVTWSWTEQDNIDHPLIRLQMTPTFEMVSDMITAAGIATFWADGSVVDARLLVAASPVQVQLVNPDQYEEVWAFIGPIYIINSENITAAPSTYITTQYPATPLATSSPSAAPSSTSSITTSKSAPASSPTSTPSVQRKSSTGTIIGGAVGGSLGGILLLVLTVGFLITRRRKQRKAALTTAEQPPEEAQLHSDDYKPLRAELLGTMGNKLYDHTVMSELPSNKPAALRK